MQGQFWKNFPGARAPETRGAATAETSVHGADAGGRRRRPPIRLHSGRPRDPRHETGPSTTFGRHPPTMASQAKIKPQVDGLRFSRNTGHGRGVGVKRSRWAGFVAAAPRTGDLGRPEAARRPLIDRYLGCIKERRPDFMSSLPQILVGPPGFEPRTQGL